MKKIAILFFAILLGVTTNAQGILNKINKAVKKDSTQTTQTGSVLSNVLGGSKGSSLSNDDIIQGLKEALTIGADSSAKRLNKAAKD